MLIIIFYFNHLTGKIATHSTGKLDFNNLVAVVRNELKDQTFKGEFSRAIFRSDKTGTRLEIRYWNDFRYFIDCHYVTADDFLDTLKKIMS